MTIQEIIKEKLKMYKNISYFISIYKTFLKFSFIYRVLFKTNGFQNLLIPKYYIFPLHSNTFSRYIREILGFRKYLDNKILKEYKRRANTFVWST